MTPQLFVQENTGKAVTYDGIRGNYGQCEQLVCLFWKYVYGFLCPPIASAKDLITNPFILANFSVEPVGREQSWDVAVFGASAAIDSPTDGHTDIVLNPQPNGFLGFDSNWGGVTDHNTGTPGYGYPAAHQVTHSHDDVLGFLRWKGGDMPITEDALYMIFRGILRRDPTHEEASNQDYLNDPDLAIKTAWNNGGAALYAALPSLVNKPSVVAYIENNLQ